MKIELNDVTNIDSVNTINSNFDKIVNELQDKVLYRSNPEGEPNTVESNIDMNGFDIINVGNVYSSYGQWATIDQTLAAVAQALTYKNQAQEYASDAMGYRDQASGYAVESNYIYSQFDRTFLGSKSANPTLDNDGNAILTGALYFNTTDNEMRAYNGSAWIAASPIDDSLYIHKTGDEQFLVGSFIGVQRFEDSGAFTYTPSTNTKTIIVEVQGAGGAGGGAVSSGGTTDSRVGSGGGGGGYVKALFPNWTGTAAIVVGTGGAGVSGAGGNPGGDSSFTGGLLGNLTAYGGQGGLSSGIIPDGSSGTLNSGLGGGTAIGGSPIVLERQQGGQGGHPLILGAGSTVQGVYSGAGGNSKMGTGAPTGFSNGTGTGPTGSRINGLLNAGAGGGGARMSGDPSPATGGRANAGKILIWEYR